MLCGTEPFPELFRAKKYKINDNFLYKNDFIHMMTNLPVQVILHLTYSLVKKHTGIFANLNIPGRGGFAQPFYRTKNVKQKFRAYFFLHRS